MTENADRPRPRRLPPPQPRPLVTLQEASKRVSVPMGTLYSWVSRRKLTPAGINDDGTKLFVLTEVEQIAATTRRRGTRHD